MISKKPTNWLAIVMSLASLFISYKACELNRETERVLDERARMDTAAMEIRWDTAPKFSPIKVSPIVDSSGPVRWSHSGGTRVEVGSTQGYTALGKPWPCEVDTLEGILFWNTPNDGTNEGQSWCYGYYVGKCTPAMINARDITFIPGTLKKTYGWTYEGESKQYTRNFTEMNSSFYDYSFKKIPSPQVYAFIVVKSIPPEKRWGVFGKTEGNSF